MYKVLFAFTACKLHRLISPFIMYCLGLFLLVISELNYVPKIKYADAHPTIDTNIPAKF